MKGRTMKSLIAGVMLMTAVTTLPAAADQYLYEGYNGYHYNHKHRKHNHNNNNNDWNAAGAFVGGIIIGGMLDRRYDPYPYAYQQPYPQPRYQQPAPRWAGPRYCESMLYYDAWGNLVQSRDCYR